MKVFLVAPKLEMNKLGGSGDIRKKKKIGEIIITTTTSATTTIPTIVVDRGAAVVEVDIPNRTTIPDARTIIP